MRLWIAEGRINKTSDSTAQSLNAELQARRESNMISILLDVRGFLIEVKVKVKKMFMWERCFAVVRLVSFAVCQSGSGMLWILWFVQRHEL